MDLNNYSDGHPVLDEEKARSVTRAFLDLVRIMARLRKECPWDREQTPQSLRKYILEESYEVLEQIDRGDWGALKEELGDFMFQALFQAQIQSEQDRFDIEDVLQAVNAKMIRRHPHVFGAKKVHDPKQVERHWEEIKRREKGPSKSLFDGFTRGMPALLESFKIGKKAAKVGFDWPDSEQVRAKVLEEIAEIEVARKQNRSDLLEEELGDLLFAVSQWVRKSGFEPEEVLRRANRKFENRFRGMERLAEQDGLELKGLDLERLAQFWERVKAGESRPAPSQKPSEGSGKSRSP